MNNFVGSLQLFGSVARFGGRFRGSVGLSGSDSWIESVGPFRWFGSVHRFSASDQEIVSMDRFSGSFQWIGSSVWLYGWVH